MTRTITSFPASPPDDRDYQYVAGTFASTGDITAHAAGIENQLGAGACTTHAVGSACELILTRANRPTDLSFQLPYDIARMWEGRPGQPGVTSLRNAIKVFHQVGTVRESVYPYRGDEVTQVPPDLVITLASEFRVSRYEKIDMSDRDQERQFNAIRSAITEGCPVVIAMRLGERFMGLFGPREAHNYFPISAANPSTGGAHAMVIEAYGPDWLDLENSWGIGWGDRGFARIHASALTDIFEAWVIRGFAGILDPATQAGHDWALAHPEEVKAFAIAQWPSAMQVLVDALVRFGISAPEFEAIFSWPAGTVLQFSRGHPLGLTLDWRDFIWK